MKRVLVALAIVVTLGLLSYAGARYWQWKGEQKAQAAANLESRMRNMEAARISVFQQQALVYLAAIKVPQEYSEVPSKPGAHLPGTNPFLFALVKDAPELFFYNTYTEYLAQLYEYNASVTDLNFEAAKLGVAPIPLLDSYQPDAP